MPVVERDEPRKVVGVLTLVHVLEGRLRDLQEERDQERIFDIRRVFNLSGGRLRVKSGKPS
jgi:hypothetical protein